MFSVRHVPGKVPGVLFLYTPEELRFRYAVGRFLPEEPGAL